MLFLLLLGVVHQIDGDAVVIKYEKRGIVKYSTVSIADSVCAWQLYEYSCYPI